MSLDPQALAVLQAMATQPAIDFARVTVAQLRAAMEAPGQFAPGDPVHAQADHEIPGPAGPLRVRIYTPRAAATLPLTLYFHGGGGALCTLDTHDNVCRCLAVRADCIVVSVDYRRAPEAPFPAAVDDALAALRWIAANAGRLGADASRLAVAGDSAGGTLAAVLAQQAPALGVALRHQLLLYPVTDWHFESASHRELAQLFPGSALMDWFRRQYLRSPEDADDPRASPLRAPTVSGAVSATVIVPEYDPLRDEGEAYAQRLREAGAAVELKRWPGQIHGFCSMLGALDAADAALSLAACALGAALVGSDEAVRSRSAR
ncbi:MAG: alpha/beta hydrolase [Gammaproteobacteria bacterium]